MARILFLERNLCPNNGGVERTSWTLSNYLSQHGCEIFFAYVENDWAGVCDENKFFFDIKTADFDNEKKRFFNYISALKIDVVINQGLAEKRIVDFFLFLKEKSCVKLILAIHVNPNYYKFRNAQLNVKMRFRKFLKFLITWKDSNRIGYYTLSKLSDKTILLSKSFFADFKKNYYLKKENDEKIEAIPNALSFDKQIEVNFQEKKEKVVLIISRFVDFEKNISSALRIWKKIEERDIGEWKLILGGYGPDEDKYISLSKKLDLKHFEYIGNVIDPIPWYKKSSIFMFTSNIEGFGLTLTEAMQFASVPIAFATYSSIYDIVSDGVNGYLISPGNESEYVERLYELMMNEKKRQVFAKNALRKTDSFHISVIGRQWEKVIYRLLEG
ncbi:glycosyltransferase [Fibrobacter sp.]|uniref:glycosyltransferase n=1 Tax=Fibrobacter sp. TaxID=35828 RepID=UPI00386C044A